MKPEHETILAAMPTRSAWARGVKDYAENEVAAIRELADDGDEEAQREVDEATAAMEAAQTALGIV